MDAWLERLRKEITETTRDLNESDWSRAPEGRWSSAQILEHLGRSYGTTAKMLELSLGAGGALDVRRGKLSEWALKALIVKVGILPSGAKAPAMVLPTGNSGPVALQRALDNLQRMEAAITAAEQRWGANVPIALHFILGPMKPAEWRKFHYVHGHHHILQMRERLGKSAVR